MRIIVASKSPRRRELMSRAGFMFTVEQPMVDERIEYTDPEEVVKSLSYQKALDVFGQHEYEADRTDMIVIGADTIVSIDGDILGKPKDSSDAFKMLHRIQNHTHDVYTGVTFIWKNHGVTKKLSFSEKTSVTLYSMTDEEINNYISTGECNDKAGAYGIQGQFGVYIKGIVGDYNNVVGMPISRIYHELKHQGIDVEIKR